MFEMDAKHRGSYKLDDSTMARKQDLNQKAK
jgi:hypothetical protein